MKLYTKIISILLVAGLASAGAQSSSSYYLKGSVGYLDNDDSKTVDSLNSLAGISAQSDESEVWSFEAGMHLGNNWSLGLEYSFFDADASMKATAIDQTQADNLNDFLSSIGLGATNFAAGDDAYASSDTEVNSFMLILNYEYFLNEQFAVLFKGGFGFFDVEQSYNVSRVDSAGTTNSPESLINGSSSDEAFAYQLGVSMNYYLTEAIALSAGLRYLDSEDLDFRYGGYEVTEDDTDSVTYDVGITYSF
jgi:opacity protein-like surface antigen